MEIFNLKPYIINEDGSLENYDCVNTITIKKDVFSLSSEPNTFYKIESTQQIKYTDYLKTKIKGKYIYHLRKADKNNEDIYVSLTWWQNLKFNIMHIKDTVHQILKFFVSLFKWLIELFISA